MFSLCFYFIGLGSGGCPPWSIIIFGIYYIKYIYSVHTELISFSYIYIIYFGSSTSTGVEVPLEISSCMWFVPTKSNARFVIVCCSASGIEAI